MVIILLISFPVSINAQIKVILDTDPSYDPDDAGCMAMLHVMANNDECDILGIINSTNHKDSPLAISAINHFYNRKAIPVGDYKGYQEKIDAPENTYDGAIALEYPRELGSWGESTDGVALYREILASAEDTSITIVIIGTMHNFYSLLISEPDLFSSLSGKSLVAKKVKQVVTMGGNFIDGKGLDRTNWGGAEELCSYTDWSCVREERNRMCRFVIKNCPAPFVASGWEVGCGDYYNAGYGNVMTGQGLKQLMPDHIIRRSYEYHFQWRGGSEDISRHSNDQCALHFAIRGESDNYVAKVDGDINLSEKGVCTWTQTSDGIQGYIQKARNKDLIAAEIEFLMMGEVMKEDITPPTKPDKLRMIDRPDGTRLVTWNRSEDNTPGSWVVGYDIYVDGTWTTRTYGTRYSGTFDGGHLTVEAINVNGVSSESVTIQIAD